MKKIYYVEDSKGTYWSSDKTRRFQRLEGKNAYQYLKAPPNRKKRFYKYYDENGDEINIELTPDSIKDYRIEERHRQYVSDTEKECEIQILSLNAMVEGGNDATPFLDMIPDLNSDVVSEVVHKLECETLKRAFSDLSKDEMELLQMLYLNEHRLSVSAYARQLGVTHVSIIKKRNRIFDKIKKYF